MGTYAIERADGSVDKVTDGASVTDVAARYGWPGNGDIKEWSANEHDGKKGGVFDKPEDQKAAYEAAFNENGEPHKSKSSSDDTEVTVASLVSGNSRDELDSIAKSLGLTPADYGTKDDLAEAIVAKGDK